MGHWWSALSQPGSGFRGTNGEGGTGKGERSGGLWGRKTRVSRGAIPPQEESSSLLRLSGASGPYLIKEGETERLKVSEGSKTNSIVPV